MTGDDAYQHLHYQMMKCYSTSSVYSYWMINVSEVAICIKYRSYYSCVTIACANDLVIEWMIKGMINEVTLWYKFDRGDMNSQWSLWGWFLTLEHHVINLVSEWYVGTRLRYQNTTLLIVCLLTFTVLQWCHVCVILIHLLMYNLY